jgi:hypothetical protein
MGPSYFFVNNLITKLKFKILKNKLSFINLDINNFSKCWEYLMAKILSGKKKLL